MDAKRVVALGVIGLAGYVALKARSANYISKNITSDDGSEKGGFLQTALAVTEDLGDFNMNGINDDLYPSMQLMQFTKMWEQKSSMPYFVNAKERSQGKQTVGYGHVILPTDKLEFPLSDADMDLLFVQDLTKHIDQIYKKIKVRLNQYQFDALCDFCFNTGPYALKVYTGLVKLINAGDFDNAANKLMQYTTQDGVRLAGLMNRRYSQMQLFRFGVYERYSGYTSANTK